MAEAGDETANQSCAAREGFYLITQVCLCVSEPQTSLARNLRVVIYLRQT